MKSQYFKVHPTDEIVNKVIECFHLNSLDDDKIFTRNDLIYHNVVDNVSDISHQLEHFYFPHKIKWVLNDLTEKSVINILRHFVKTRGYNVHCFGNQKKEVSYRVIKKDYKKVDSNFKVSQGEFILNFN